MGRKDHFADGALFGRLHRQLESDEATGGGYSVHMVTGERPYGKWMVGNPTYGANVRPMSQVTPGVIRGFVNSPQRKAGLRGPARFAGGWRDEDSAQAKANQDVYQDVSDAFEDRHTAFYATLLRNEKAMVRHPDRAGQGFEQVDNPAHVADKEMAAWKQQHQALFGA